MLLLGAELDLLRLAGVEDGKRIERLEKTISALLEELPYNTAHATALARIEFDRQL